MNIIFGLSVGLWLCLLLESNLRKVNSPFWVRILGNIISGIIGGALISILKL